MRKILLVDDMEAELQLLNEYLTQGGFQVVTALSGKEALEKKKKWLEGVKKEFDDFKKRGVWKIIRMKDMPEGIILIGNKWVFKVKRDGR